MAVIVQTLADFVSYLNSLFESDSTAPSSGDEDYTVWTALANTAINIWEKEEGIDWKELYTNLSDAADGDTTIEDDDWDYDCPTDFDHVVGKVRLVSTGGVSSYFSIISPKQVPLADDTSGQWCYFTGNNSSGYDLHFNPDLTLTTGDTIKYEYYKKATKLSATTDKFEMSDPMFAVFYALSELKKEEGNADEIAIATQKLEAMKVRNMAPSEEEDTSISNKMEVGFGV